MEKEQEISLTLKEAAKFLGVSSKTILRYIKHGFEYNTVKNSKGKTEYRFKQSYLTEFKKKSKEAKPGLCLKDEDIKKLNNIIDEIKNKDKVDQNNQSVHINNYILGLEDHVKFLVQQIQIKDDLIERLTHQNEVLLGLAQEDESPDSEQDKAKGKKKKPKKPIQSFNLPGNIPPRPVLPKKPSYVPQEPSLDELKRRYGGT